MEVTLSKETPSLYVISLWGQVLLCYNLNSRKYTIKKCKTTLGFFFKYPLLHWVLEWISTDVNPQ